MPKRTFKRKAQDRKLHTRGETDDLRADAKIVREVQIVTGGVGVRGGRRHRDYKKISRDRL